MMIERLASVRRELRTAASAPTAAILQRFFKTGPGEYGEGDRFLGIKVPPLRAMAKRHADLEERDVLALLRSAFHEERLLALLIMVGQYQRGKRQIRHRLHAIYLENTAWVNNWDLVDSSAEHLVGAHLEGRSIRLLQRLAGSKALWERRIGIIATFHFIRRGEFGPTLAIAELLLGDEHDLIHKACGWMLREVGKRDQRAAEAFLKLHQRAMPRTMLRYAIERFPAPLRTAYLAGIA